MTDLMRGEQSKFDGEAAFAHIHLKLCSINS